MSASISGVTGWSSTFSSDSGVLSGRKKVIQLAFLGCGDVVIVSLVCSSILINAGEVADVALLASIGFVLSSNGILIVLLTFVVVDVVAVLVFVVTKVGFVLPFLVNVLVS